MEGTMFDAHIRAYRRHRQDVLFLNWWNSGQMF
jgi:hypothetical protein